MFINNKDITLEDAIRLSSQEELVLKRRENNLLLSDYQISVLRRNGIDFMRFSSPRELLFEIESYLDNDFDDELDMIGLQISEYIYYNETKK